MSQPATSINDSDTKVAETSPASIITAEGIPIRNIWHMLLYAWDQPHRIGLWRADVETAPSLNTLLALILANLIEQRLRIGLGRDYATHVDEIPGIRGRVLFGDTIRRMSLPHGKTVCRYQVFTPDVPKNQIVRSTLATLVDAGHFGRAPIGSRLRGRLRKLVREMDAAQLVAVHPADVAREQLRRHDQDYALMLAICRLVQSQHMPTEDKGVDHAPSIGRDVFKLNDVYERFVVRFYERTLLEWFVQPHPQWKWPTRDASSFLPCMYPDIVLEHRASRRLIVIDTKFTPHALASGRWGDLRFSRDHLFQIYAYLRSQSHRSPEFAASTGVLLYPTARFALRERVEIQGHAILWETVDLSRTWEEVESQLLAIPPRAA